MSNIAQTLAGWVVAGGAVMVIAALLDPDRKETVADMVRITGQYCAAGFGVVVLTKALIGA